MASCKVALLFDFLLLAVIAVCIKAQARHAVCYLEKDPNSNLNVHGTVKFYQDSPSSRIQISVDVVGLNAISPGDEDRHGFHVHEIGDVTTGCAAALGHYNPFNVVHGGPNDQVRHEGDFGNLRQNCDGTLRVDFTDERATLFGDQAICGRSIVLHEGVDDLGRGGNEGSLASGNAGARLACCPIILTTA